MQHLNLVLLSSRVHGSPLAAEKLAQGRDQVKQLLRENKEVAKAIYRKVQEVLREKRTVEAARIDAQTGSSGDFASKCRIIPEVVV